MTRAEKLAQQERHRQAQLVRARQHYAEVKHRRKQAEQQARDRRYLLIGAMVQEAGLLALDDATLAALFALVARLTQVPHPVPVLETLLQDVPCTSGATTGTSLRECGDAVGARAEARLRQPGDADRGGSGTAAPVSDGVAPP